MILILLNLNAMIKLITIAGARPQTFKVFWTRLITWIFHPDPSPLFLAMAGPHMKF